MGDKNSVLATAATLARKLDVDRALVWSARLRAAGHGDVCPLVAQAQAPGPALERARAAAVAYRMFGDERAYRAYQVIAVDVTPEERRLIRAETATLCPALAPLLDAPSGGVPADHIVVAGPD